MESKQQQFDASLSIPFRELTAAELATVAGGWHIEQDGGPTGNSEWIEGYGSPGYWIIEYWYSAIAMPDEGDVGESWLVDYGTYWEEESGGSMYA